MPLIRKPAGPQASAPVDAAAVLAALSHGTDDERWTAARAAAGLPDGAVALSAALAHEPNARVREAIFTGLAQLATPAGIEAVIACVRSDDAALRTGALDALRAMHGAAAPYVPQLLRDPDADVRVLACELARNLPGTEGVGLLCELLDAETEPNVCASAVEILADIGGAEVLPALERCENRFSGTAFLAFAIQLTAARIRSQSSQRA